MHSLVCFASVKLARSHSLSTQMLGGLSGGDREHPGREGGRAAFASRTSSASYTEPSRRGQGAGCEWKPGPGRVSISDCGWRLKIPVVTRIIMLTSLCCL